MWRRITIAGIGLMVVIAGFVLVRSSAGTPGAAKKHYVGFVPPAMTSPFHVTITTAMRDMADQYGWTVDIQAPASESDAAGFITTVQQLLEKGVEIVSINPIQVDTVIPAVRAANARGVPVLAHNLITPFKEGNVVSYIGYDQWGGAQKLGEYTCQLLAGKYHTTPEQAHGKVFILLGGGDSIHVHRRTGGYIAGLAKCPAVQVVGEQSAEWDRGKGAEVATAALQKTPDIDVFYGNSDEMDIGASLAAERLGLKIGKDYFALGIDGNQTTLDLIRAGKVTATLGVDPYRMGQTVFRTMQKVLDGQAVPQILLTPSVVVDASNLDDYLSGKLWTEPVSGQPELDNGQPTIAEGK